VNKHGGGLFTENTLASLGASAAVAIENAQLVAEQKRFWQSLIETLATTVGRPGSADRRPQQAVTRYAAVIGRSLGWAGKDLEKLQAAALLHATADRDRVIPPEAGKLDEAEFEYMKAHAEKTAEFLQQLVFPLDMARGPNDRLPAPRAHGRQGLSEGLGCGQDPHRRAHRRGLRRTFFEPSPRRATTAAVLT